MFHTICILGKILDDSVYSITNGAGTTCNLLQQCITFWETEQYSSCAEERYVEEEDDDAIAAERRRVSLRFIFYTRVQIEILKFNKGTPDE